MLGIFILILLCDKVIIDYRLVCVGEGGVGVLTCASLCNAILKKYLHVHNLIRTIII